ncbi:serine/threonine-protein phosphatase 7 long form homolog [Bidens hawaiensis]|uniref:serine/threonine-protein phosphatase 7 long form homolog n=1 Tax=Bidens hawaiensis TaxID=980011 RepID=UPI004049D632
MPHIRVASFGGGIERSYKMVDNHLVTTLVERWRPETHTFHFKFGVTTITLEDVQVLWGLPIGDEVVSGRDNRLTFSEQRYLCNELLGLHVEENDFKTQKLRLTRLTAELGNDFPEDASEDDCVRRARVHRDLWPINVVAIWAWEIIIHVSPTHSMEYQSGKAYGSRSNCHLSFREIPNHAISHYRSQLQSLQAFEFNWMPYFQAEDLLPKSCLSGKDSWRCDTALLFWEVVEPHLPSRVMRQFGMVQTIPRNLIFNKKEHMRMHKVNRKG